MDSVVPPVSPPPSAAATPSGAPARPQTAPRGLKRLAALGRAPSPTVRNERALYGEAFFQSISNAGALTFVSVFLVRLGSPNWLVGFYTALPALVMILFSLPMGAWVRRQKSLVATVNRTRILFRGAIGSFALLPFLPPSIAGHMLVAVRGLASVPDAALVVAETTLIGRLTTPQRRARMLSTRAAVLGLYSAIFGFLAGQWLDRAAWPFNYQMLFLTAFLSGLGSAWALGKARVPDNAPVPAARKTMAIAEMLALVRGSPAFARFLIAEFIFRIGMTMPVALYAIYRVRDLGSTDGWIGILQTIEHGLLVVSYLVLARLLTREWVRRWLWLGCVGMALFPLATAMATTPRMLVIAPMISGLFSPSMSIFLTDTLYRVSPEDERPAYVATNAFLNSITGFAVPLLGTLLSDLTSVRGAIMISAGLRLLGGLSFLALGVVGPRRLSDVER